MPKSVNDHKKSNENGERENIMKRLFIRIEKKEKKHISFLCSE